MIADAYDPTGVLARAGGRAKSDVANKLVAMVLHTVSRSLRATPSITSIEYRTAVRNAFSTACPYCGRQLAAGSTVVEHLDAMNQFRAGLHVPGNVLPACRECNNEKRREDLKEHLDLAPSGWESFLSHDGMQCNDDCRLCGYWRRVLPLPEQRVRQLADGRHRIASFRREYLPHRATDIAAHATRDLRDLYVECQRYADKQTQQVVKRVTMPWAT